MTQAIRICLVKKELDAETVVPCLESIQFRGHGEIFLIPEEFQPLSSHPVIAGRSRVIQFLETMREVNVSRYLRIVLTEEQMSHYLDRNGNFRFARQLLEESEGPIDRELSQEGHKEEISSGISKVPPKMLNAVLRCISPQGVSPYRFLRILLHIIIVLVAIMGLLWMSLLVSKQQREMHRLHTEISSLRSEVREPTKSSLIWRIPNITEKLRNARPWKDNVLLSEPFFTSTNGYKLRAQLQLCDFFDCDHLTVFIEVLPGEFDPILRWFFGMKGSLTLIDQAENPDEAMHITDPEEPIAWPCRRPLEGSETFCMELPRFASHATLRTRDYIKDDTIFLKIEIEEKGTWPFVPDDLYD